MELRDLIALIKRRWGTVLLCPIVGLLIAAGLLWFTPTTYTATSSAYVRVNVDPAAGTTTAYSDAAVLADRKVKTFVPVFTSANVTQKVIAELGDELELDTTPERLAEDIEATNVPDSLTINVTVRADTRERATRIADAVVTHASQEILVLEGETSPANLVLMSSAEISEVTKTPSPVRYLGVGLLGGLLAGLTGTFAMSVLDTRLRSTGDISRAVEAPALGALPARVSSQRQALDRIRAEVFYTGGPQAARTIMVTSAVEDIDVWTAAEGLARSSAHAGQPTVLIDARLHAPSAPGQAGLSEVLAGRASMKEAATRTQTPGLLLVGTGRAARDPASLLASPRMGELLEAVAKNHYVVLAAPALHPRTEARSLAPLMDRVVILAQFKQTTAQQLRRAVTAVEQQSAAQCGVVLCDTPSSALSRFRYSEPDEA
ncbi:polysaccharide biosynthesis tyrosine autokinase [Actinomyces slackii]|uniref:Tyrosine-protein kinase YwqD n=1 Tax=Actinomyces slackii TaxID=52774 RepID=A0A3S4WIF9_9ACTO|nr:polysaccharide biosynthesis tyrosine autokinase [Actinomyces slackii]VEG75709.1 Tyrosine-protein kinase YwqD [Actinomyces slackii]